MNTKIMTADEAEYYVAILKRPRMHLGECVTFPQVVGFIMGHRHAQFRSHGFGFGTFNDFILEQVNVNIDKQKEDGRWAELIIKDTANLNREEACDRLSALFSEWALIEREISQRKESAG